LLTDDLRDIEEEVWMGEQKAMTDRIPNKESELQDLPHLILVVSNLSTQHGPVHR
jgi:hypothetical protein